MTISGFLLRLGELHFWPIYLTLMAADLTGDTIWYVVGYHYGHRFAGKYGRYFGITPALVQKSETIFKHHHNKILLLSKITMGMGLALVILVTAGMMRVPFKKYIVLNAIGQLIWTGVLLALGYFFGNLYLVINKGLRDVALLGLGLILLTIIIAIGRYFRQRYLSAKV